MSSPGAKPAGLSGATERRPLAAFRRTILRLGVPALLITAFIAAVSVPSTASTPKVKKPGAPTNVRVIGVNSAIAVSWTAPTSDGGATIGSYTVTTSHGDHTCTTDATTCTVSGLTNGLRYIAHVRAANAIGEGRKSASVEVTPTDSPECSYVGPYANLSGCNLTDADLSGANLTHANLNGTNLTDANLDGVSSGSTTGTPAELPSGWSLVSGYLIGPYANLNGAELTNAGLSGADLTGATLTNSYLSNANLDGAILINANLLYAYLNGANMTNANLTNAEMVTDSTDEIWSNTTCPDGTNSDNDGNTCAGDLVP